MRDRAIGVGSCSIIVLNSDVGRVNFVLYVSGSKEEPTASKRIVF